jgi:hypothetical protein
MQKNESMMIAAAHFWSDTTNTFMFGHGPSAPTLADVYMLTGLDISTVDEDSIYGRKAEYRVNTRNIGGWTGYIQEYQKTGTINQKEHAIFLNRTNQRLPPCSRTLGQRCQVPARPIPSELHLPPPTPSISEASTW